MGGWRRIRHREGGKVSGRERKCRYRLPAIGRRWKPALAAFRFLENHVNSFFGFGLSV
jgi:hypothetical protein